MGLTRCNERSLRGAPRYMTKLCRSVLGNLAQAIRSRMLYCLLILQRRQIPRRCQIGVKEGWSRSCPMNNITGDASSHRLTYVWPPFGVTPNAILLRLSCTGVPASHVRRLGQVIPAPSLVCLKPLRNRLPDGLKGRRNLVI